MALNQFTANGKLPHFDGTFKPAEGEKKAFLAWAISVKRDFKPADAQYYPEDLINFKAFGAKAEFINKFFQKGDGLIMTGRIQREDDYTDKDNNPVKGQLVLMVENVSFAEGTSGSKTEGSSAPAGKQATGRAPVGKTPVGRAPVGGKAPVGKKPW